MDRIDVLIALTFIGGVFLAIHLAITF